MHTNRPKITPTQIGALLALGAISLHTQAHDDPDLRTQVDALRAQVDDLQKHQANAEGEAVTAGTSKGSFKLPGSNTSVTFGGYLKLDAVLSNPSAGVASQADQDFEAGAIPVGPNSNANEKNQFKLHARQSRLFVKTSTPTQLGDLTTYVEADFFGAAGNETSSNSNGLRVRHAYGTLGHILAGQTWTTFLEPAAIAETVEFNGPAGQIFARQAQVRWTQAFDGGQWSIALENPETQVTLPDGTVFRADDDRFPDIAANVKFNTAHGNYTLAGLVRQIRLDSAKAPTSTDSRVAGGVGINGVLPIGKDDVRVYAYYGNGIGRYANGLFTDGILDTSGKLQLADEILGAAAYRHFWSDKLRSSLAISGLHAKNPAGTAASANKTLSSAHLNLIWSPVPQTNFGIEYIFGHRETQDGSKGNLNRLQAAAQFFF